MSSDMSSESSQLAEDSMKCSQKEDSKSIETIVISNENIDILEKDCLICMESLQIGEQTFKLICGHYYHNKCITQWLQTKSSCPHCRQHLIDNPFLKKSAKESDSQPIDFISDMGRGVPEEDMIESIIEYEITIRQYIYVSDSGDDLTDDE